MHTTPAVICYESTKSQGDLKKNTAGALGHGAVKASNHF
jgi:hypothetical protein